MASQVMPQASLFSLDIPVPPKDKTSLAATAMLSSLNISQWSGYKYDPDASEEIATIHGAEEGKKPKLYKSMVTNIVEIVDVLPRLNIGGDEELDRMAESVRRSLLVDTEELRKSETLRTDTAKAAADIMQRMAAYMGLPTDGSQVVS